MAAGELDVQTRTRIADANEALVSAASIWEIAIKRAAGSLDAPADIGARAIEVGYDALGITFDHAREAGRLPLHHRDPFDRMLVAQARVEGLTLLTADAAIRAYDVPVLAAGR